MRSIYRSKKHAALIDILTDKDRNTDKAAFPTIKALQCYAAMLGFEGGRRVSFDKDEKENIEWHTFKNDDYTDYIYMIALAETKNFDVLRYDVENSDTGGFDQDMVKIFEEYANGGFHILQTWLDKKPGDPYGAKAIIAGLQKSGKLSNENAPDEKATEKFDKVDF